MAVHAPTARAFTRGQQRYMETNVLPAPIGGMDGRLNLASNDLLNCVYAYNLVPTEYGMRTREGYREWQIDIETTPGAGLGVRTVLPYHGVQDAPQGADRLFVSTNEGIWDATLVGGAPVLKLAYPDVSDASGWGIFTHYTTDAGEVLMYLADSANGLHVYDPDTDSWSAAANITGPDPAAIVFVVVHKQRIWFVEREVSLGWYLDVGAKEGPATPFYFGGKFKHGGELVGLYNWTIDSGSGVDDYLVAISRAGDVLPYQGADPALAATWENVGTYYIGTVPAGRRVASEYGGNLHLLSNFGVVTMSDLLAGIATTPAADNLTLKMSRFIREDMAQYSDSRGWEIKFHTSEGVLLINSPRRLNGTYLQYRVNMTVNGWAFWRGVPMLAAETWRGKLVFGTADSKLMRMDVGTDAADVDGAGGAPVEFSLLHNFFDLEAPSLFKFGEFIRPNFLATQRPTYAVKFLYDYTDLEIPVPGVVPVVGDSQWDVAQWDRNVWKSGAAQSFSRLHGQSGAGRTLAVALRGSASVRTTLVSSDVMWRPGSPF